MVESPTPVSCTAPLASASRTTPGKWQAVVVVNQMPASAVTVGGLASRTTVKHALGLAPVGDIERKR